METSQTWFDIEAESNLLEAPNVLTEDSLALQSQYTNSPRIKNMGLVFRDAIDATETVSSVGQHVLDPASADNAFLDWWGKRVGVDRYIYIAPNPDTGAPGRYVRFDDDYFRFLIFYRAAVNVAAADAYTTNKLLSKLTDTTVFVVDYQDMTINSVVIIGAISDIQAQVLQNFGLLNRPAGVLTNMLIIYPDEQIFGFAGSNLQPFAQGVFNPGRNVPIT